VTEGKTKQMSPLRQEENIPKVILTHSKSCAVGRDPGSDKGMHRGRQRCQGSSWYLKTPVCSSRQYSAWRLGWSCAPIRPGSSKDTAVELLV